MLVHIACIAPKSGVRNLATIRGIDAGRLRPFLNLEKPSEWYPEARRLKRRIICHVGPTNSGKTHGALQELVAAKEGRRIYCAPLRLLAIEMYERLNHHFGLPCSLRTGEITCGPNEDGRVAVVSAGSTGWQEAPAMACTVEMADLNGEYEVAVIDEVQMLGHPQRGWAFTQALLGLRARTLYLCGEEAAVPLIQRLCKETGDELIIRHFKRLSPLRVDDTSLGNDLRRIKAGDCMVAFSRSQIFDLKARIEQSTSHKCAVVYGSLPMESRSQQAKLFNEAGSDFNVLVASDAVGMGLNLNIRRVIFQQLSKFNGVDTEPVAPSQVKQIAGRAGRFGTAHETGIATTLQARDHAYLQECMQRANDPVPAAGLLPTADHVVNLAAAFPQLGLSAIVDLYKTEAKLGGNYFLCFFREIHQLALLLEAFPKIQMRDRFQLACAPVKKGDGLVLNTFRLLMQNFHEERPCPLRVPHPRLTANPEASLRIAESVYRSLDLYLWLATHFPDRFLQAKEAWQRREDCGLVVNKALEMISHVKNKNKTVP